MQARRWQKPHRSAHRWLLPYWELKLLMLLDAVPAAEEVISAATAEGVPAGISSQEGEVSRASELLLSDRALLHWQQGWCARDSFAANDVSARRLWQVVWSGEALWTWWHCLLLLHAPQHFRKLFTGTNARAELWNLRILFLCKVAGTIGLQWLFDKHLHCENVVIGNNHTTDKAQFTKRKELGKYKAHFVSGFDSDRPYL